MQLLIVLLFLLLLLLHNTLYKGIWSGIVEIRNEVKWMFISLAIDDDKGLPSIFELLDKNQQKSQYTQKCMCLCNMHTEIDAQHVAFVFIHIFYWSMIKCWLVYFSSFFSSILLNMVNWKLSADYMRTTELNNFWVHLIWIYKLHLIFSTSFCWNITICQEWKKKSQNCFLDEISSRFEETRNK